MMEEASLLICLPYCRCGFRGVHIDYTTVVRVQSVTVKHDYEPAKNHPETITARM